jgi:conjugal transfer pilus assembly protein TraW
LVAHTRYFKTLAAAVLLAAPLISQADNSASIFTDGDRALFGAGKHIQENPEDILGFSDPGVLNNPHASAGRQEAEDLLSQLRQSNDTIKQMSQQKAAQKTYQNIEFIIFASLSLQGEGLEDILEIASTRPEAIVVFRGIPEGMKINEAVAGLQQLAASYDPMPNVVLDPTLFERHHVTAVPTIIKLSLENTLDPKNREALARVEGLTDPAWLEERVERGETGNLGVRGPLAEIGERNLIEVMKERVAKIDWTAKGEQAKKRFWYNQDFHWLPPATRSRTRQLDPSVYVTQDITDEDGKVLVAEGTTVNPLDLVPFTQALVVFDPLDHRQMKLLDEALPGLRDQPGVKRLTFIATQFDPAEGWDNYKSVTDHFEAPVYLLTPDLIERFELEFTPSVITSDGENFVIRELTPRDL